MRRFGVLLLVLPLFAACGSSEHAQLQRPRPPKAPEPLSKRPSPLPRPSSVRLVVIDGDLSTPVRGATVHVMGRPARTDRRGVARIVLPHRGRLVTTVAKRGYDPLRRRIKWSNGPLVAVHVFQTKPQWTMYGA